MQNPTEVSITSTTPPVVPWHVLPATDVLNRLSSTVSGLSQSEAKKRFEESGPNELQEGEPINPWRVFLAQFKSLIVWILIVAALISGFLGEWLDCIAIVAIVILNAIIGFQQEYTAERSIAALKKMTAPQAKVMRAGRLVSVPASEIVPGDVIAVESGDLVAADARLLEAADLRCIESALTGESVPVTKQTAPLAQADVPLGDRSNMLFMGTSVACGTGSAVIVATAMHTAMGSIAGLIKQAAEEEDTPLQQRLQAVGKILVLSSLGIVALLFILGTMRGLHIVELFLTSVSLAVAAVPEGLPAVVTVALALGVKRMAQRNALVRRLPSVETMGSTTVICSDKTGTLTVGQMTVRNLYVDSRVYSLTGEGYDPEGQVVLDDTPLNPAQSPSLTLLSTIMAGCNRAQLVQESGLWNAIGDPTEAALLIASQKLGLTDQQIDTELEKVIDFPFNSDRKRATTVRKLSNGQLRAFVIGAPDVLLELCTEIYSLDGVRSISQQDAQKVLDENSRQAASALRVLAAAYRDIDPSLQLSQEIVEQNLTFVGLAGMYDPPRAEAKAAVATCRKAGIKVVMITGDHPNTAFAVAKELGIALPEDKVLSGQELNRLSDLKLRESVAHVAVYARVTAAHKMSIVRAWKENGAIVAMTGDGVNDAPAIKAADIGIAMGKSGTEVTKQAADMIITDDNFASIVAAAQEGRGIYQNIRKTLQYLLAGNTGEILLMTACILMGLPVPLLPIHLLWINLVTDGLPALCLATDPVDPDIMKHPPRRTDANIMDRRFLTTMAVTGLLTAGVSFAVYLFGLTYRSLEVARTNAFAALVFAELIRSFGARSEYKPVWKISLTSNVTLAAVVGVSFGIQVFSHHNAFLSYVMRTTTISWSDCSLLILIACIPLIGIEILKYAQSSRRCSA